MLLWFHLVIPSFPARIDDMRSRFSALSSKTRLDGTTHEQTIICRQLFGGHVVDSRPIEREEKTHRMIISNVR